MLHLTPPSLTNVGSTDATPVEALPGNRSALATATTEEPPTNQQDITIKVETDDLQGPPVVTMDTAGAPRGDGSEALRASESPGPSSGEESDSYGPALPPPLQGEMQSVN